MNALRTSALAALVLLLAASVTWAGGRPPADALLLMRNGDFITGDVFTVNDRTVSMLTDYGIQTYDREDVSNLVFLQDWNALVLRAEGAMVGDNIWEGEIGYVGGVWDGRSAGTFVATVRPVSEGHSHEMISIHLDIVRNTLSRGTLEFIAVGDGQLADSGMKGYQIDHEAGVITAATGDYADCVGTVEMVTYLELESPEQHVVSYFVLRFDAVH